MRITRAVAPAAELVTLAEVKGQLRITHADDDVLLTRLIAAVTEYMDGYDGILCRALITQDWKTQVQGWRDTRLPLPDLQSIQSVVYVDADGTEQTLSVDAYSVEYEGDWPVVCFHETPALTDRGLNISIVSRHGYGSSADDVPQSIRHAAILLVGHYHENTEATSSLTIKSVPLAFESLVSAYRMTPQF